MAENSPRLDPDVFLDLLGNEYRRRIIRLLSSRKLYPQQISEILGITPSAVIKNLKQLEEAGLIEKEEVDREKGGRPYQYFSIKRNITFSFDIFNPTLIKWVFLETEEIEDDFKRPELISGKSAHETVLEYFREVVQLQDELTRLERERIEKLKKREHLYEILCDLYKQEKGIPNIVNVFRTMLEIHGPNSWFTLEELEKEANLKSEEAREVLRKWQELNLIEVDTSDQHWLNPRIRFKF